MTATVHSSDSAIRLRGVRKSFGDRVVLDGVDLDVYRGETLVVLGRSGTGKSVLIKLLVGLLEPDDGAVCVLGDEVPKLRRAQRDALRRKVGFSFQGSALYDSRTVAENLAFPLRINEPSMSEEQIAQKVEAALTSVGLLQTRDQMPAELSGGQRKRIGIARTLILEPEIMLYDEPTAGLDPLTSADINALICEVRDTRHTTSIVITHDLACARQVGDRVAMLLDGKVFAVGTFEEVFALRDPRVAAFYDYNFTGETKNEDQ